MHVYVVQSVFVRVVVARPIDADAFRACAVCDLSKILVFTHDLGAILEETGQTIILVGGTLYLLLAHFFEICRDSPVLHVAIKALKIVFFRALDLRKFVRLCRFQNLHFIVFGERGAFCPQFVFSFNNAYVEVVQLFTGVDHRFVEVFVRLQVDDGRTFLFFELRDLFLKRFEGLRVFLFRLGDLNLDVFVRLVGFDIRL